MPARRKTAATTAASAIARDAATTAASAARPRRRAAAAGERATEAVTPPREAPPPCECADGGASEGSPRRAVAVSPEAKTANLARLRRIEGQVRGLQRMVDGDRYCPDILTQVAAVQEALRSVCRELLRNHLRHCVARATREGGAEAEAAYDEVLDLVYRSAR